MCANWTGIWNGRDKNWSNTAIKLDFAYNHIKIDFLTIFFLFKGGLVSDLTYLLLCPTELQPGKSLYCFSYTTNSCSCINYSLKTSENESLKDRKKDSYVSEAFQLLDTLFCQSCNFKCTILNSASFRTRKYLTGSEVFFIP